MRNKLTSLRPNTSIDTLITRPTRRNIRVHKNTGLRTIVVHQEMVDLTRAVPADIVFKGDVRVPLAESVKDALLGVRRAYEVQVVEESRDGVVRDMAVRERFDLVL